jgi:hypothetical protein
MFRPSGISKEFDSLHNIDHVDKNLSSLISSVVNVRRGSLRKKDPIADIIPHIPIAIKIRGAINASGFQSTMINVIR